MSEQNQVTLSEEQKIFLREALNGKNILVNACVGSGKTTAIQKLCDAFPKSLKILYLTYNRLLKIDAKTRIKSRNVTVTNYHGFAASALQKMQISCGIPDLIQTFNQVKPAIDFYDVLIIDEYQDIETELAELLDYIKAKNPDIQIIVVGDLDQKIYDKTTLNVPSFIQRFLGEHIELSFTICFRLPEELATKLGRIWHKTIQGVNRRCSVEDMTKEEVIDFLTQQQPQDILCLGKRAGMMADVLNALEEAHPEKFNKKTVFASISDRDGTQATAPKKDSAIFTTYDSSKGMEREICVIFDFDESYWGKRLELPQQSYEILRNIFCVAASRGKRKIIFARSDNEALTEEVLLKREVSDCSFKNVNISHMFDFKYQENIEECYQKLQIAKIENQEDSAPILINSADELIDLSPCIGTYQEASFFGDYNIDFAIDIHFKYDREDKDLYDYYISKKEAPGLDDKILLLTSIEGRQNRYYFQVKRPFVSENAKAALHKRLGTVFSQNEKVQVFCRIPFCDPLGRVSPFEAGGLADVVKDGIVYELKYVADLTHAHFLQCASYVVALGLEKGILWNTRNNEKYEIRIPNRIVFLDCVAKTITKGYFDHYEGGETVEQKKKAQDDAVKTQTEQGEPLASRFPVLAAYRQSKVEALKQKAKKVGCALPIEVSPDGFEAILKKFPNEKIAVIDTETNFINKIISVGAVVAEAETFTPINSRYYAVVENCGMGAMFENQLILPKMAVPTFYTYGECMGELRAFLQDCGVQRIFAYNAAFDYKQLPELSDFEWYDIMRVAAYRQYNKAIPSQAECFSTGKLKKDFGVENIYRLLSGQDFYLETHNAVLDAMDELQIMALLGRSIEDYSIAKINGISTEKKGARSPRMDTYGAVCRPNEKHARIEDKKEKRTSKSNSVDISEGDGIYHFTSLKTEKSTTKRDQNVDSLGDGTYHFASIKEGKNTTHPDYRVNKTKSSSGKFSSPISEQDGTYHLTSVKAGKNTTHPDYYANKTKSSSAKFSSPTPEQEKNFKTSAGKETAGERECVSNEIPKKRKKDSKTVLIYMLAVIAGAFLVFSFFLLICFYLFGLF